MAVDTVASMAVGIETVGVTKVVVSQVCVGDVAGRFPLRSH